MTLYNDKNLPPWPSGTLVRITRTTENSLYPFLTGCIGVLRRHKDLSFAVWTLNYGYAEKREESWKLYHYTMAEVELEPVDPDGNLVPIEPGPAWDRSSTSNPIHLHEGFLVKLIRSLMGL